MIDNQVSVIIVNYNAGKLLTECVKTVLASSASVKVYVSDNGSTDNSIALLRKTFNQTPNLHIHKNNANLGFSAGNNAVYSLVDTPYVLYLNPDCIVKKDTIETLISTMEHYPEAGVVGCLVRNPDGSEQRGCRGLTPTPRRVFNQLFRLNKLFPRLPSFSGYHLFGANLPDTVLEVELISGSCMFVRRTAIEQVGLLDESYFLYCEDSDWCYRFLLGGWKIFFTAQTDVMHIKSHSAKKIPLRVLWYKAKGMWLFHNKFFKDNSGFFTNFLVKLGISLRFIVLSFFELLKKPMTLLSKMSTSR